MINGYPRVTRGQCPITEEPALQALLASDHRFGNQVVAISGVRSGVVCNGMRNGGDNQHVGLANPHPRSIVNGTNREREVARPTVAGTPTAAVIPANLPPKSDQNQLPNPFSWSAKPPANSGGMLLAGEQPPPGAASPYAPPKLAVGAASDPGA